MYNVNQGIELLFGDEFGLSVCEISEEGKDAYCRGEACSTKHSVEDF